MALSTTQEIQRRVFLDIIQSFPELTLTGLARLIDERFAELAGGVSVGDLLGLGKSGGKASQPSTTGASAGSGTPSKRGRGRPKGSKTKSRRTPAAAAPAAPSAASDTPVKRGPGRPKGSKTKTSKVPPAKAAAPADLPVKRGPGRPKGAVSKGPGSKATASKPATWVPESPAAYLNRGKAGAKRAETPSRSLPPAPPETRTQAGRDRYDAAVRDVLQGAGGPLSAVDLRARAGGDDNQARASLRRLIESGEVGYQGATNSTRYFLQ